MAWKEWVFGGPRRLGQVRWLTQFLILSGALNIAFCTFFVTSHLKHRDERSLISWRPANEIEPVSLDNIEVVSSLAQLSLAELIGKLDSAILVEDGYAERDLALALLVSLHHFDLERAVGEFPQGRASLDWKGRTLPLFSGLGRPQWEAIGAFCRREEFPLTPHGLWLEARRSLSSSVIQAFALTPHAHMVHVLLSRATPPISQEEAIALALEMEWESLDGYLAEQRAACDLSEGRRRRFLLDEVVNGSMLAAHLLARTDLEFALHRPSNEEVVAMLGLLKERDADSEAFAIGILQSKRPREVLAVAAESLSRWTGKPLLTEERVHDVAPGESLWAVAQKYSTSVEAIIKLNSLESERIRVGQKLRIPQGTGS